MEASVEVLVNAEVPKPTPRARAKAPDLRILHEPGFVLLEQGYIKQSQAGINGMVEQGHALKRHFHAASFVYEAIDLLLPGIGKSVDHKAGATGSSLPVDSAHIIAQHIIFDLFEFKAVAQPAYFFYTTHGITANSHQLVFAQLLKGRVYFYHSGLSYFVTPLQQSDRAGGITKQVPEVEFTS